jgi:hypothetical protein
VEGEMRKLIILLLLTIVACGHSKDYKVKGYIRNTWQRDYFYVVIEHDTGESTTLRFINQPPVWTGEHVILSYRYDPAYNADIAVRAERLP